jgi:UrcA family protein
MTTLRSALRAAVLTSVSLATVAQAAEAPRSSVEVVSVVVGYGDLDLQKDAGVAQLQRRLEAAARKVCGHVDPRDIKLAARTRQCIDTAMKRAVGDVGSPKLARLNADRAVRS